jgi:hypothetical protein
MEGPISPPPVVGGAGRELPAYLSNGVVGLKVRDNPLSPGMTLLSGFSGEHPERKIEAAAFAPYPIAGDVSLDGVWMSEATHDVRIVDQACNFSTGELTTRLTFRVGGHQAKIAVMAFLQPRPANSGLSGDLPRGRWGMRHSRAGQNRPVRHRRAGAAIQP